MGLLWEVILNGSSYHIPRQLVPWQIFNIFMIRINDLSQLPALDHLFIHPHVHHRIKAVGGFDIVPDDLGNGGAPGEEKGM